MQNNSKLNKTKQKTYPVMAEGNNKYKALLA